MRFRLPWRHPDHDVVTRGDAVRMLRGLRRQQRSLHRVVVYDENPGHVRIL